VKFLGRTLTVLVLAAAVAGYIGYWTSGAPALHAAMKSGDAMAWLRTDFQLDDQQYAEIKRLHEAYAPSCEEHCRLIREAARARDAVAAKRGSDPAAVAAAERTLQELRSTCETAIAAHVRKVAAVMTPEQGARYLALVLPKIADFDHQMAPNVALKSAHQH
jgi:hypothetical protein